MELRPSKTATAVRFGLLALVIAVFAGLAFAKSAEAGHKGDRHGHAYASPGYGLNLFIGPSPRSGYHARSHSRHGSGHGPAYVKPGYGKHGYAVQPRKRSRSYHGLYNYKRFMVSPHGYTSRRHDQSGYSRHLKRSYHDGRRYYRHR